MIEKQRYYIVDFIRFSAAMMVLMYHYSASDIGNMMNDRYKLLGTKDVYPELFVVTKYGFLGVPLFFLISGFVILASALNRDAISFAISRWTRLYPTYWIAVGFTTVILAIFLGSGFDLPVRDFFANLTMLNDYLGITDIDPVYWTLHAELQFYGCVFLLIISGLIKHYRWWLSVWLLITFVYAFTRQPFFMPWFISPGYSSYFIAGAVFYLAARDGYGVFHATLLSLSLVMSLYQLFPQTREYIQHTQPIHYVVTNCMVVGFYGVFFLISTNRLGFKQTAWVTLLGGLTYPLYLTHHVAGRYIIDYLAPHMNRFALLIGLISVALVVAFILYELIDRRLAIWLRHYLTRLLVRKKTVADNSPLSTGLKSDSPSA